MIELLPFTNSDFTTFKSWIKNEKELYQFAGPIFNFPLTDTQLNSYLKRTDLIPYKVVLKSTGKSIGHCELNFENGNKRLSRILIGDESLRGQKIGKRIVIKMIELFFQDNTIKTIDLNVFDWNIAAIKCYESVGFKINQAYKSQSKVDGKVWKKLNMYLDREEK